MAVRRGLQMKLLAAEGCLTEGTVATLSKTRPRGGSRKYRVSYTYRDNFGRSYRGGAVINYELWSNLKVGSPLEIVYAASKPQVSGMREMVNLARKALKKEPI
ncbi:MAG: DUF3592 domain-containing protein [Oligoflexia bacterium]|nr:DUF3592 domain-containing protein [Oligoflexia bacterium]